MDEQKRIAGVLGAFDDKIELLQKQNKTLEDMAKAIFKSWFVDFDIVKAKERGEEKQKIISEYKITEELYNLFPSSFTDAPASSSLGPIPTGWEVKQIKDIAILTMGQSPSGNTYNEAGEGLPFYQGRTDFGFRFPSKRVYCSEPTRIAQAHDILISVRAPVGDLNIALERCCIGRGVGSIRSKTSDYSFIYYSLLNIQNALKSFDNEGTVFGSINKDTLSSLKVIYPQQILVNEYDNLTSKLDNKIEANTKHIQTLTELRDGLLPRLLSGKLRV
jgi:type I restriction enzyme S subunit